MTNSNRLYRLKTDKVIGGVSGGLGDYLNIDPVIIRVLFVLLFLFGGSGVLVYIILWIAIPSEPIGFKMYSGEKNDQDSGEDIDNPGERTKTKNSSMILGIILIGLGFIFLIDHLVPYYSIANLWPLIIIIAGVLLISPELLKSSKNIKS